MDLDNSKSTFDRDALQNSLLIDTVKLFALVAKADGVITDSELTYVQQYFADIYPKDFANYLHEEFLLCINQNIPLEEVTAQIKEQLGLEAKIFLLGKMLELVAADEVKDEELTFVAHLAKLLGIEEIDYSILEALMVGRPTQYTSKRLHWMWFTGLNEKGDVLLPAPSLQLLVLRVNREVFVLKKNTDHSLQIGRQELTPNRIYRLQTKESILINDDIEILPVDLKFYFQRQQQGLIHYYLTEDQHQLVLSSKKPEQKPLLLLILDQAKITVEPIGNNIPVFINGTPLTKSSHLLLGDTLQWAESKINLRKLLFYQTMYSQHGTLNGHQKRFSIGNYFECDILVDDDLNQPWHCTVERKGNEYWLNPTGCPYPMKVNRKGIRGRYQLSNNDYIHFQNLIILWNLEKLTYDVDQIGFRHLEARELSYTFHDKTQGLQQISFYVNKGEMVGIMGPSGSGKSTLLNVLNGYHVPQMGEIRIDEMNLHEQYMDVKDSIGYVPQDDLLFENLTVYENLYFNACLRYPQGIDNINVLVNSVLHDIGLYNKKHVKVGSPENKILSGGQRKRLNIGLELLAKNDLLLLDEPTSGLSSKDSERIMQLVKRLAQQGKIIFVVIHQPSNRLYNLFEKIILLDQGGRLAFFGEIEKALQYFQHYQPTSINAGQSSTLVGPELLFDVLEQPLRDIDGKALPIRRYSPEFWQDEFFKHNNGFNQYPKINKKIPSNLHKANRKTFLSQLNIFLTLFKRNFVNKLRNKSNIIITFLIPPTLALIVGIILRYSSNDDYHLYTNVHLQTFLFLAALIAVFLGITNSIEEIIRDRRILLRERMLGVSRISYYFSKFFTLSTFAAVQVVLFLAVGFIALELRELFLGFFFILFFSSLSGIALGLAVSSFPKLSGKGAVNLVPIILIPQIIFGGALVEYKKMNQRLVFFENSPIPEICQFMPSRWAFEALCTLQGHYNSYHPEEDRLQKELDRFTRYDKDQIMENLEQQFGSKTLAVQAYEAKKDSIVQKLEAFRKENRYRYGNNGINLAMQSGRIQYERQLANEESYFYPLFVKTKRIAYTDITLPTPIYNALVIIVIILLLIGVGLLLLYVLPR